MDQMESRQATYGMFMEGEVNGRVAKQLRREIYGRTYSPPLQVLPISWWAANCRCQTTSLPTTEARIQGNLENGRAICQNENPELKRLKR